ncbi:hypothetical protein BKA93DRAFT_769753 [Sparassis latifolia]|uniref:3-keto-steroid reductase n=1 Tax=Sparassis crispa TaxID=139825 RepID=A0A401GYE5_9APHY|nr:predicted protein [Sparassis crispa]GBE87210.1 predicted protein [Sparassis crispa]
MNGSADKDRRLIVIVTGANGGVGFGTCHRLLVQLSQVQPPDALPRVTSTDTAFEFAHAGLTIIMACRDLKRAEAAREKLYTLIDERIMSMLQGSSEHDYAVKFRENLVLAIHRLDLSSVQSVLDFGAEISQEYPYISHLICNAGLATYSHVDFLVFLEQFLQSPRRAVESPRCNVQKSGVMSKDGLGFVWQCNIFGHYVLFRTLQPLLSASSESSGFHTPARVLWISSIDVLPAYDTKSDWQLTKTKDSYQASKFQLELMILELSRRSQQCQNAEGVQHLLLHPGISPTSIASEILKPEILRYLMLAAFFVIRLLAGCRYVNFSVYHAALATVHVALAPLAALVGPPSRSTSSTIRKFGTESSRWGEERLGCTEVTAWDEHPDEGKLLVDRCEGLYQTFLKAGPISNNAVDTSL